MYARRYGYFLHGTMKPDDSKTAIDISSPPAPGGEVINPYLPEWIASKGASGHSAAFQKNGDEDDWEYFNHYGKDPAILALQAALDAIWFLSNDDPTTREPAPKYEAAACSLGAMCHLIADAAVAGHVTHWRSHGGAVKGGEIINENAPQWIGGSDKGWENWVVPIPEEQVFGLSFDPSSRVGGGPRWGNSKSEADPGAKFIYSPTYQYRPQWPDDCVRTMGYLTFTGYDKDGNPGDCSLGEFASVNLVALWEECDKLKNWINNPDGSNQFWDPEVLKWTDYYTEKAVPNTKIRVYETPEWAAYYCAKAIRWVMDRVNLPENTFYDVFSPAAKASGKNSRVTHNVIKEWIKAGTKEENVDQWIKRNAPASMKANMMTASYAMFLVAIFCIPLALEFRPIPQKLEQEV